MTLFLSIIAFVVIFSVLILIHELGHFFVAKKGGIKVEEFGLGIPPRVWSFKPKNSETTYSLNAIPFGGFVRLYGEDSHDPKAIKSKRSFAGKPAWIQILVVTAGVVMNFFLGFILLTAGLMIGMQPLFTSPQDIYAGINSGVIKLEEGLIVKQPLVKEAGFEQGDQILALNDRKIIYGDELNNLKEGEKVKFEVNRKGTILQLEGVNEKDRPLFEAYSSVVLPHLLVGKIDQNLSAAGIQLGDTINNINGEKVFDAEILDKYIQSGENLRLEVADNGKITPVEATGLQSAGLIISAISPSSPAQKADLKSGDEIISLDGQEVHALSDLSKIITANKANSQAIYQVKRAGNLMNFTINKDDQGLVGIMLSQFFTVNQGAWGFYIKAVPYSVLEIKDVSYPWYEAPGRALSEVGRLSRITVQMFGTVLAQLVTKFTVPEGVAGPVGIAQMTYTFVQEGLVSLIRFTALLSLSLGIINILPFPGLDGGRFFIIVISAIVGKKLNPRVEGLIHLGGFLILMLLILLITFNDVMRILA